MLLDKRLCSRQLDCFCSCRMLRRPARMTVLSCASPLMLRLERHGAVVALRRKLPADEASGRQSLCIVVQVKLVDAGFVWTEPHSRRIKVKLTVQAEVMNGAILQQTFVVEHVVEPHMCMDCTRANTNTSIWTACAQVLHRYLLILHFGAGLSMLSTEGEHMHVPVMNAAACLQLRLLLSVEEPISGMARLA